MIRTQSSGPHEHHLAWHMSRHSDFSDVYLLGRGDLTAPEDEAKADEAFFMGKAMVSKVIGETKSASTPWRVEHTEDLKGANILRE